MQRSKKHIRASFFLDLFLKGKSFPSFYKKITTTFLNNDVYSSHPSAKFNFDYLTYSIYDIPNYLETEFDKTTSLKLLTAPLYPGYIINLTCFKNLEDYLNNHLGKPRKSQLKRYRKRLDICIAPNYKVYYGDISKDEYNILFNRLILMTERRFAQKEELNFELPFLELYRDMMYSMMLNKKASIFVIYHGKKPINITLNFIDNACIFHWNSCYDVDYQMFNLGHVNMVNHLEWAFNKGFKLFDMGRGDFLHKRKYVNESYIYNEHIVYNSKSLPALIIAHLKLLKLKLRYGTIKFLKKFNFHLFYGKYAKYKYRVVKSRHKNDKSYAVTASNITEIPSLEKLALIDLDNYDYDFLIKPLNYFLYKNQDNMKNVKVLTDLKDVQTFYFKGVKMHQKVTIKIKTNI